MTAAFPARPGVLPGLLLLAVLPAGCNRTPTKAAAPAPEKPKVESDLSRWFPVWGAPGL